MNNIKLLQYLDLAKAISVQAGKGILAIYNQQEGFQIQVKENSSPLTLADQIGHEILNKGLMESGLPVLSEEGKEVPYEERKQWEFYWLIDPLDGTKEFIKRNGEFTVNVALIESGIPVLGVVYVPVTDTLYWGAKENGAFKQVGESDPIPLRVNANSRVKTIVASRSHISADTIAFIEKHPHAELISMGSSLKFLLVAEGRAEVYPRFAPTMEWDTAAAQGIVEASGGVVLNYPQMTRLVYNRPDMLNGSFICHNGVSL